VIIESHVPFVGIRIDWCGVSLAAAGTAGFISLQAGRDLKSGPHRGIHEIDFYGFNTFKEIFIDHEGHSLFCKNDIVIP
jgi:hypothetical protein